jgi:hypothetical protein
LKRRRFAGYPANGRFVVFSIRRDFSVQNRQIEPFFIGKRTPTGRDRKPRFPSDADFSALKSTRRPDVNARRSKKLRVLATFFESVVPVAYRRRPSRRQTTQENIPYPR